MFNGGIENSVKFDRITVDLHRVFSGGMAVVLFLFGGWQVSQAAEAKETAELIRSNAVAVSSLASTVAVQQEQISTVVETVNKAATTAEANARALARIEGQITSLEKDVERSNSRTGTRSGSGG